MSTFMSEPVRLDDEEHGASVRDSRASAHSGSVEGAGATREGGSGSGGSRENLVNEKQAAAPTTLWGKSKASVQNRWQKVQAHMKRRWPIYLIVAVLLIATILPIFLLVIIPFIMQKVVDGGKLPVYDGLIYAVSPDRVALNLSTQFPGINLLKVGIDPMNISLYNADRGQKHNPYVIFPTPYEAYTGNTNISINTVEVGIANKTELVYWLSQLLRREDWSLDITAKTHAHLGALKGKINLDKKLKIKGLNKLGTLDIEHLSVNAPAQKTGANLKGKINIGNPSPLAVNIGNLTLNALSGNLKIGEFKVDDFLSTPGKKLMDFYGTLSLGYLVKNLFQVLRDQRDNLPRGVLGIGLTQQSVMVHGQHIDYVEAAINGTTLKTELPLSTLLGGIIDNVKTGDLQLPAFLDEIVDGMPGDNKKLKSLLVKFGFSGEKSKD